MTMRTLFHRYVRGPVVGPYAGREQDFPPWRVRIFVLVDLVDSCLTYLRRTLIGREKARLSDYSWFRTGSAHVEVYQFAVPSHVVARLLERGMTMEEIGTMLFRQMTSPEGVAEGHYDS